MPSFICAMIIWHVLCARDCGRRSSDTLGGHLCHLKFQSFGGIRTKETVTLPFLEEESFKLRPEG